MQIIDYARIHKSAILAELTQNNAPGKCESCPAAGYWDLARYAGQDFCVSTMHSIWEKVDIRNPAVSCGITVL